MKRRTATTAKLKFKTRNKAVRATIAQDAQEPNPNRRHRKLNGREVFWFPEVRGKTLDKLALYTSGGDNSISLRFQDNTGLSLSLEPGFTAYAEFYGVQEGEMTVLKEWRPIPSGSLRQPLK
jgi:hypothetical protein